MSYLRYLCLFAYSGVQHIDYMRSMAGALQDAATDFPSRSPEFTPSFGEVRVAHHFSIMCCVFCLFVFVLCLVYPMLPVSLDCQLLVWLAIRFSLTFI